MYQRLIVILVCLFLAQHAAKAMNEQKDSNDDDVELVDKLLDEWRRSLQRFLQGVGQEPIYDENVNEPIEWVTHPNTLRVGI